MAIAYLVHNVNDAAVRRRTALFEAAGLEVRLGGFHRDAHVPARVGNAPVTALGRTGDGALARRALSVLRHVVWPSRIRRLTGGATAIVARNLETLVLARRAAREGQRVVYECLDIHRLLLGDGAASRWLHRVEGWALRRVDLVVLSAPAFRDIYFRQHIGYEGDILLVENLVPRADGVMPQVVDPDPAPPWVIGWFGMLRCRRTFEILKGLAASGVAEVLIAGRASTDLFPDFEREVEEAPGVRFLGAYKAEDLPGLFGRIHFIWAIDYFEEGLNSVWLLPNRLYESIAHGAVPLALASVATGAWLQAHGAGVLMADPAREVPALLDGLTPEAYRALRSAVAAVPTGAVTMDETEACHVARQIVGEA